MQFVVDDLIKRARTYVADDHDSDPALIPLERWLDLFNVEYRKLYRRWVSGGLITPPIAQTTLTADQTVVNGVLAVVGVGEDLGSGVRVLRPAQVDGGLEPFWRGVGESDGVAESWAARGTGDNVTVELYPHAADIASGKYFVRYIATPAAVTNSASSVELPFGADERLVLGMARRALLKDSAASRALDSEIRDADAELGFVSFGRLQPKVRRRTPNRNSFELQPSLWRYFG